MPAQGAAPYGLQTAVAALVRGFENVSVPRGVRFECSLIKHVRLQKPPQPAVDVEGAVERGKYAEAAADTTCPFTP